jgi:hypothetical protein
MKKENQEYCWQLVIYFWKGSDLRLRMSFLIGSPTNL